jgi:hypothetical protein
METKFWLADDACHLTSQKFADSGTSGSQLCQEMNNKNLDILYSAPAHESLLNHEA